MANNTENIRRLLPPPKRPPGQPPNPNAQKKLSIFSPSPDNISQRQGGNDAAAAAAEASWSKQDLAYLAAQVRAAREDAHRRRPGNIAQRWSRPVTGYLQPDRRRAYFAAPLYVVDRRGQVGEGEGEGEGEGAAGRSGTTYGDSDVQMDMEAVDGDGDTVMCCCGCDDVGGDYHYGGDGGDGGDDGSVGGQGGEVCRFRRLLCDLGEEWTVGGDEVEVEFMEEEVDLLVRAMRESHVSDAGVKALFERKAGHGLDRVARQ